MSAPLALIAAGGTGGHMFPAQALAELLLEKGWRVRLSTDDRGARYAGSFPDAVERSVVQSATTARGGVVGKLTAPFKIAAGVLAARKAFSRDRPSVVIGFGGYPTIPALAAAVSMGLPRMIHEQNGVMGRVNGLFASRVHRIACGTWPTELPKGVVAVHTGNPVRASVKQFAAAPYRSPTDGDLNIVVIGGSQGARILSDVVPEAIAGLPPEMLPRLKIAQQARQEDSARVVATYAEAGIHAEVSPFFDDIPERFANAQLIIARAGASTIADVTVIGRPSILVPLAAAIRDEQSANAHALVEAGAAEMLPEAVFTPDALTRDIRGILSDPAKAEKMAAAAQGLGRPDAVLRLFEIVTEIKR